MTLPIPVPGRKNGRKERGVAAVELALIFPVLLIFLLFPIFFGRVYWHYTVAQKAAQDAARYMSSVPAQEMRSRTLSQAAANVAIDITRAELAELAPGSVIGDAVIQCGTLPCGSRTGLVPATVRVVVTFKIFDTFFGVVDTGRYGWDITADITMNYAGT
jgi:Flp pilus assembly protein TadG